MFKPGTVALGLLCTFVAVGTIAVAQDKKPADKPAAKPADAKPADAKPAAGQPSAEEMAIMKTMKDAATPGEGHAKLKPLAGKWSYVTKWRMAPGPEWEGQSTGKAECKWILGNRILLHECKNDPGQPFDAMMGAPFEGHGMTGYDNMTKKYWSTWNDNMGTGIMTSEGTADGSGKVFTYESEYNCPMKGPNQKNKTVMKIEGDDKYHFQMFDKGPDGKEFQSLEVTYTRVK
jgi:hypothetical protein